MTWLAPGDRVFGMPRFPQEAACYAEYVVSPSRQLARIPEALADVEAAAVPLAGLTAWQALVDTGARGRGLARARARRRRRGRALRGADRSRRAGAWVAGTACAAKHDFLPELGGTSRSLQDEEIPDRARDVDVVLDAVGGEAGIGALQALRDGGMLVTVSGSSVPALVAAAGDACGRRASWSSRTALGWRRLPGSRPRGSSARTSRRTFPLEEAGAAHALGEQGRTRGKLVLTV